MSVTHVGANFFKTFFEIKGLEGGDRWQVVPLMAANNQGGLLPPPQLPTK